MFPSSRRLLTFSLVLCATLLPGCTVRTVRTTPVAPGEYLFCFWNVENLFDDHDNPKDQTADKPYDDWFAHDATARSLKYEHVSEALAKLQDGKGPDILALAEVESERSVELLRDALNRRLPDASLHYASILFRDPHGGRHIATAILTRLRVVEGKTQLLGRRQRILEGHLDVNGHELVVIASHWTSRVTDQEGEGRDKYADIIYGRYRAMYEGNPSVDLLICGDFNDPPDEESVVRHLHARGNAEEVCKPHAEPLLLNLLSGKDATQFGTHYHSKWYIFDQIVVSPGMLDPQGWACEPGSVQVINTLVQPKDKLHRPWPFGSEREKRPRGYSDHFPVTVRLRVQGN